MDELNTVTALGVDGCRRDGCLSGLSWLLIHFMTELSPGNDKKRTSGHDRPSSAP
jgi:hypothetical protein